jgi:lipopolysaccharide transport system ATP-binding protein
VTQAYLAYQESKISTATKIARAEFAGRAQEFHLIDLAVNETIGDVPVIVSQGHDLRLQVRVHSRDGRVPVVGVGLGRADGTTVYGVNTEMDHVQPMLESHGIFKLNIDFPNNSLLPGSYEVRVHALDTEGVRLFDTLTRSLTVRGESREFGLVRLQHAWTSVAPRIDDIAKPVAEAAP